MVGFGKKRGLASIEYLFVAGLSLSALAVIIIVGMGMGNDSVRVTQAKDTVDSLGKAADYVYALGPGSKETVSVWLPQGIIFVNASGNQLHMRVGLSSGETDVYAKTNGQLIGGIRPIAGAQEVTITAIGNGRVLIGRPGLACEPAAMTRTIPQGGTGTASIIVTNTAGYNITGIAAGKSGAISAMTDVTQPASALAPGASSSVGLAFSVPAAQAVGSYGGLITVAGSNESECSSSITLFVTRPGAPDTVGPVVTNINHAPPAPHTCSQITITASADDTGTGNSPILGCQLELDGSGIWNSVQAGDGAYDEPQEDIAYPLGSIGLGDHTVRIRCTDSAGNTGSPSSHTFSVSAFASRPILFISSGGSSNPWSGWMAAHQSNMSLSWSYDQNTTAQVESGLIDLMAYKIVIMDMSDNNPTLNAMLNDFRNPADITCDNRNTCVSGLKQRVRKPFFSRRQYKNIKNRKVARRVRDCSQKMYPILNAGVFG